MSALSISKRMEGDADADTDADTDDGVFGLMVYMRRLEELKLA